MADPSLATAAVQQVGGMGARGLLGMVQPLAMQLSQDNALLKNFPLIAGLVAITLLAIRLPVIAGQSDEVDTCYV